MNYTWIKGNHSLKFGYEYEHIWMGVFDNNPLYGSFTFGGGYSACHKVVIPDLAPVPASGRPTIRSRRYLLGGLPLRHDQRVRSGQAFEAHLRQTLDSAYVQDDWKVLPNLTLNLGLRWEYGSPYSEQNNYVSNWDPASQTVFTINPNVTAANAANGITPTTGAGVYGKTLDESRPERLCAARRLRVCALFQVVHPRRIRHRLCALHARRLRRHRRHQRPAGAICQLTRSRQPLQSLLHAAPCPDHRHGNDNPSCYATAAQGFPSGLVTSFNYATDNITWVPKNTRDSYVENYYLAVQRQLTKNSLVDIAYVGNHGLKLQGFLNGNQRNIIDHPARAQPLYSRPFANWPSDITEALNEFYLQLQRVAGAL